MSRGQQILRMVLEKNKPSSSHDPILLGVENTQNNNTFLMGSAQEDESSTMDLELNVEQGILKLYNDNNQASIILNAEDVQNLEQPFIQGTATVINLECNLESFNDEPGIIDPFLDSEIGEQLNVSIISDSLLLQKVDESLKCLTDISGSYNIPFPMDEEVTSEQNDKKVTEYLENSTMETENSNDKNWTLNELNKSGSETDEGGAEHESDEDVSNIKEVTESTLNEIHIKKRSRNSKDNGNTYIFYAIF